MNALTPMIPIFMMIAIGSLFVSRGWFPKTGLPTLSQFVMNVCIPVLLFSAIANGKSLATFSWTNAVIFAAASLASVAVLWGVLRYFLREPLPQSIILALGGATANSIFLGFPIASVFIADRAAEVFSWIVFAEVAFIIPIVSTLALLAERTDDRKTVLAALTALVRSPVVLGLAAGFAFQASGLTLTGPLEKVVGSITAAAPFLALFVVGGSLLEFRVSRSGPRVLAVSFGKLILHPLFVALAFTAVFGWQAPVTRDALLFAAMPLFLSYSVFCGRHAVEDVGASSIVLTTVLGAATVTLLLAVLF